LIEAVRKNPSKSPYQKRRQCAIWEAQKAAKDLGITVPLPLLGRADEVVE